MRVAGDGGDAMFWVAAEQLPMLESVYPAPCAGASDPGAGAVPRARVWDSRSKRSANYCVAACRPWVRHGCPALATLLALPRARIDGALAGLETEGFVLRGQFNPGVAELEWCERRLLARIHRYTIRSLRSEIEPVVERRLHAFPARLAGPHACPAAQEVTGLAGVIEQLEGFEVPAIAWEGDVLPARHAGL